VVDGSGECVDWYFNPNADPADPATTLVETCPATHKYVAIDFYCHETP